MSNTEKAIVAQKIKDKMIQEIVIEIKERVKIISNA